MTKLRDTQTGVEYAALVTPALRDTEQGVEFVATVVNTARIPALGIEYVYRARATCTAEFIQAVTPADIEPIPADDAEEGDLIVRRHARWERLPVPSDWAYRSYSFAIIDGYPTWNPDAAAGEPVVVPNDSGGFDFVFDADGNQIFL